MHRLEILLELVELGSELFTLVLDARERLLGIVEGVDRKLALQLL